MKRCIALLLVLCLSLGLCACGSKGSDDSGSSSKKKIEKVEKLIDDIGTVTLESGDDIAAAREKFDALKESQQEDVENLDVLEKAEAAYAQLVRIDENTIKDYAPISAEKANMIDDTTLDTWYSDGEANAVLDVLFLLQAMNDQLIVADDLDLRNQYVAIDKDDARVDIYATIGDGQIMGIQYWPDKGKSQIGFVDSELEITEFLDLMVEGGVIDQYKLVSFSKIGEVIDLLGD